MSSLPTTSGIRNILRLGTMFFFILALGAGVYLSSKTLNTTSKAATLKKLTIDSFKQDPSAKYVKGEILVKLKDSTESDRFQQNMRSKKIDLNQKSLSISPADIQSLPLALQEINRKYPIKQVEKVFKGTDSPQKEISKFKQKFTQDIAQGKRKIKEKEFLMTDLSRTYKLKFDTSASIDKIVNDLQFNSQIEYAEPNYIYKTGQWLPNDPYFLDSYPEETKDRYLYWAPQYDYQWNLKKISADIGWNLSVGSSNIIVAVIDTGVDCNHPELQGRCVEGYDFPYDQRDQIDDNGHGTYIAGIISAKTNNKIGMAGMNWNGKIMPVKVLTSDAAGTGEWIAKGIKFASDKGAQVINLSIYGEPRSQTFADALEYAYDLDIVTVTIAGNDQMDASKFYPASDPHVIVVAATDENDKRADFSNFGNEVDVAAPGVEILSLRAKDTDMYGPPVSPDRSDPRFHYYSHIIADKYYRASGTSFAAPHVAALAALIKTRKKTFSNEDIRQIIRSGVDSILTDKYIGTGRINVSKALRIDSIPQVKIISPVLTDVYGKIDIKGLAAGPNFSYYILEYALGRNPQTWQQITKNTNQVSGGVLSSWDTRDVPDGVVTLKLSVFEKNGLKFDDQAIIVITNKITEKTLPGWPVRTKNELTQRIGYYLFRASPIIANLDGAKDKEIIYSGQDGKVYAFKYTGKLMQGWPVEIGADTYSSPAVADLDLDGKSEVVAFGFMNFHYPEGSISIPLSVFDQDGRIKPGWPLRIEGRNLSSPVIANLDSNHDLEIIASPYMLKVFHHDATQLKGWPVYLNTDTGTTASPAVADIDNDGVNEIIEIGDKEGGLFTFKADGSKMPGWPVSMVGQSDAEGNIIQKSEGSWSSPAVADIDNDGVKEIIFANNGYTVCLKTGQSGCNDIRYDGGLFAINSKSGKIKSGWPFGIETEGKNYGNIISSPAIGNLSGDDRLEIVIASLNSQIYAFDNSGKLLPGNWPVKTGGFISASPVIADIDGDSKNEIIIGSSDGYVYAFEADGSPVAGWPLATSSILTPQDIGVLSTVAIDDIDGDGLSEIIIADNRDTIYALKTNSPVSLEWPMFHHDARLTGYYPAKTQIPVTGCVFGPGCGSIPTIPPPVVPCTTGTPCPTINLR